MVALIDADPGRVGGSVLGCPVLGGDAIAALRAQGVDHGFVGLGGTGDAGPRRTAAVLLRDAGFRLPAIVHRSASVATSAALGEGVQVLAGAIVGHDVHVGEAAHVASGARVGGDARIGAGAHVGAGAVVLQGRAIGDGAIVGAGAVVIDDVPPGARVGGIPAAVLPPPRPRR